jgi:glutathione synthase
MSCNYISGNNIYGDAVRDTLIKLQKLGSQEDAAYILMQRIFPTASASVLMRNGCWHKDRAISELGVFGTYLRYIAWLHIFIARCTNLHNA